MNSVIFAHLLVSSVVTILAGDLRIITNTDIGGGNAGIALEEDFDALVYLERAGYLDSLDGVINRHHAPDSVKKAIREFQQFTGLPVSGRLDKSTVAMMKQPRCGVPDVIKPSERPEDKVNDAPLSYISTGLKWHKTQLTYKFKSYTNKLTYQQQRTAVARAFKRWSDVTPLTFTERIGTVDIDISFGRRDHGDGRPFDGPGGTLAHSWFPGYSPMDGDVHFDDDEDWSLGTPKGRNFEQVATHEIGHTLGLAHTRVRAAAMYASNIGFVKDFHLHLDDIQAIQSLYGPHPGAEKVTTSTPAPRQTITGLPTPAPTGPYCDLKFDAVEQVHDGNIFGFVGSSIYNITEHGPKDKRNINEVFRGAPSSPGAVVFDKMRNVIYFFKGSQFWRFSGYTLHDSFPRTLPKDFQNVDAAIHRPIQIDLGKMILFQGTSYVLWHEGMTHPDPGYPRQIGSYFLGGPQKVDSAFVASNGYLYMFSDKSYWRYGAMSSHLSPGYPKDTRPVWLNCGSGSFFELLFGLPGK